MNATKKRIGIATILSLALFSGGLLALPNNAYEIDYYDENGNLVGQDSYYCGRNHPGLDWGYRTNNSVYTDLGRCYGYSPNNPYDDP